MIDTVEKKRATKRNCRKAREPKTTDDAEVPTSAPISEVRLAQTNLGSKASLALQLLQHLGCHHHSDGSGYRLAAAHDANCPDWPEEEGP